MKIPGFTAEVSLGIPFYSCGSSGNPGSSTDTISMGKIVAAAGCPLGICNKKKYGSLCEKDELGNWVCEGGHSGEECYEEWFSDHYCNPISYASCHGSQRYPDCQ